MAGPPRAAERTAGRAVLDSEGAFFSRTGNDLIGRDIGLPQPPRCHLPLTGDDQHRDACAHTVSAPGGPRASRGRRGQTRHCVCVTRLLSPSSGPCGGSAGPVLMGMGSAGPVLTGMGSASRDLAGGLRSVPGGPSWTPPLVHDFVSLFQSARCQARPHTPAPGSSPLPKTSAGGRHKAPRVRGLCLQDTDLQPPAKGQPFTRPAAGG